MDHTFIEPLVRRAINEKLPDSLYSIIEILKRLPSGGMPAGIPGIGENLSDAIRQLIVDNIFTIKGLTMDPITELDVLHRLTEALEENPKRDFLELVFPADNRNTYDLMCKLVSYSISMKYQTTLRKCSRYFKSLDLMHPLRVDLVSYLRSDFCQISRANLCDLAALPTLSRDLCAVFTLTLCMLQTMPLEELLLTLVADWLTADPDLMGMVRPQTSNLIRWCLMSRCQSKAHLNTTWRLHLSILQGFHSRASKKKHAYLSGSDMKTWVDCIKSTPDVTATDMLLQIVQVALHTQALHLTKEELEWCVENLPSTEFSQMLQRARMLEIS